jgi:UDP-glucose 4-epimerase
MKWLLLGGTGYIGSRLAAYLKSQGHGVRITTRRSRSEVPRWISADEVLSVNLDAKAELAPALDAIDAVVDLAAPDEVVSAQQPLAALKAGAEQTWIVLETLTDRPAGTRPLFLYMSTFHVYGPNIQGNVDETTTPSPVHPYALGRYLGETIVQTFRKRKLVNAVCLRLSNAFGAPVSADVPRWSLVFNDLCRQAVSQHKLTLKTAGLQRRNFITLEDTVRAIEFIVQHRSAWPEDGVLHVGSSAHWSIQDVAQMVSSHCHRLLGYAPPIESPQTADLNPPAHFQFSVERLKAMGFQWNNAVDEEIEATLNICRNVDSKTMRPV